MAAAQADKKLLVQIFDLVKLISSFVYTTGKTWSIYMAVYGSLHRRTYDRGSAVEINGVYTMMVRNYSALTPMTEFLRRRYMNYILW